MGRSDDRKVQNRSLSRHSAIILDYERDSHFFIFKTPNVVHAQFCRWLEHNIFNKKVVPHVGFRVIEVAGRKHVDTRGLCFSKRSISDRWKSISSTIFISTLRKITSLSLQVQLHQIGSLCVSCALHDDMGHHTWVIFWAYPIQAVSYNLLPL
jgi:hypothetical protein